MNHQIKLSLCCKLSCQEDEIVYQNYCAYLFILFLGLCVSVQSNCQAQTTDQIEPKSLSGQTRLSQVNQDPLTLPAPIPNQATPDREEPAILEIAPEDGRKLIKINKISVIGSTVFELKDFESIIKPVEGKEISLAELKLLTDKITQLYLNGGYITSRAIVVSDSLTKENIQIKIIEGVVEEIKVIGAKRLIGYVRSRVKLGADAPLNTGELEEQLRLLRIDPLVENIEAQIGAGSGIGQSTVIVRVEAARPLALKAGIDNYSPPSIGSERLNFEATYQNLTGWGDRFSLGYHPRIEAFGDSYNLDFQYQIPINAKNGTITAEVDINRNKVINSFAENLDINGESERYRLSYRQPFIRSTTQELALSLGFDYQNGQTFLFQQGFPFGQGADNEGISRTSVLRFGQDYTLRQASGAWSLRSNLNFGLGMFDATKNDEPIPDGQFFSWLGQVQRLQVLNDDNFLIIQGEFQFTPDSLLPSQQFVIGGGQSIRGYRQNVRSGDNGLRFSVEDRLTLVQDRDGQPQFILAPFLDLGTVWNNGDNPNQLPDQNFLAALGLGLIWEPIDNLNLRLDYAPPLVDLSDRGDNLQDNGLHFSINYNQRI
ncbi:MAG: ShlB/FhaC/HecB family hemolysin secretion/activation protein [Waterburya sp.]